MKKMITAIILLISINNLYAAQTGNSLVNLFKRIAAKCTINGTCTYQQGKQLENTAKLLKPSELIALQKQYKNPDVKAALHQGHAKKDTKKKNNDAWDVTEPTSPISPLNPFNPLNAHNPGSIYYDEDEDTND